MKVRSSQDNPPRLVILLSQDRRARQRQELTGKREYICPVKMKFRDFVFLISLIRECTGHGSFTKKPHVIFVLIDDLGYDDLGNVKKDGLVRLRFCIELLYLK